ncbi:MAG: TraE/TraK family type IV conjugative transfer system protein [Oligoflexales bacterium]
MIGPREKGIKQTECLPPKKAGEDAKYRGLPKYISYRAALLREKLVLSYMIGVLSILFISYFSISRIEISQLYNDLRSKEYILAPGVQSFTAATPKNVPDSYIEDAANDFLSSLGNVNASTIEDQYQGLVRFMSRELRVKFEADSREWIQQTRSEDLAQIFKIKKKEISTDGSGSFHILAYATAQFYSSGKSLGNEDQVVEMTLKLVPPNQSKRWYLEITKLSWTKLDDFRKRKNLKR